MSDQESAPASPEQSDEGTDSNADKTREERNEYADLAQLIPQNFSGYWLTPAQEERRHELAQAALSYAARGWKVIPVWWVTEDGDCACKRGAECASAGKHPIPDGWPDVATSEPIEVASWWREPPETGIAEEWYPKANVGIVTGGVSGLFVLDEDPYNGGERELNNYQARHGDLPRTRIQNTGGGGRHYVWQYPGFQIHNNAGKALNQGLDIRGDGGFIVMPPSVSSKGAYEIENPAHDIDPAPAPGWLLELLKSYDHQQRGMEGAPADIAPAALASAYAQAALEQEAETVRSAPVGARNERLNAAAFALGTLGGIGLIEEPVARAKLTEAAKAAGLGDAEIVATFRSGWESGTQHPRTDLHLRGVLDKDIRFSQDEFGLAARMVYIYGASLCWLPGLQHYRLYGNGVWSSVKHDTVRFFAHTMLDNLFELGKDEYEDEPLCDEKTGMPIVGKDGGEESPRDKWWAFTRKVRTGAKISTVASMYSSAYGARVDANRFDSQSMKFVWANGLMELETGETGSHDPFAYSTMSSSVVYDPDASQVLWMQFLDEVMPDPEMQAYLQRISGYCLTGSTKEQAAILHWGTGANGKSVWLEVMAHVLGSYAQVVPAATLLLKPAGTIPNDIARMRGQRFLQVSETPHGKRLDEEVVKSLTGGELITARFMRGEFFDYKPSGKINLVTNHLPHLSPSHSIWRRLHVVPWEVTIPEEEQDKELARKLIAHAAPGVAAWAVQGCLAWQQIGLAPPEKALMSKQQYRHAENRIAQWVADEVDIVDMATGVTVGRRTVDLYESWTQWNKHQGFKEPGTRRSFTDLVKEEGYTYVGTDHKMRGFPQLQVRLPDLG
jgi:putative DNA primase/helicase